MKRTKSKVFVIFVALATVVLLTSLTLVKLYDKNTVYQLSRKEKARIESETKKTDVDGVIRYSLSYTAAKLQFSRTNDVQHGKANCVGYASFCASVCNAALTSSNIQGKAHPVVGYIRVGDVNLCKAAESILTKQSYKNFVKDHDFVELVTKDNVYQFDPCLYDIVGVSCLSKTEKK